MRPFFKTWLTICLLMPLAAHATNREQRLPNVNGHTAKSPATVATLSEISVPSAKHPGKHASSLKVKHGVVTTTAVAGAPNAKQSSAVLSRAVNVLGTPYRWGGSSPSKGFDCSGLVKYAFNGVAAGDLPRTSNAMAAGHGLKVDRKDLKPGDLLFFNIKSRKVNHVAIYLGNDRFIHAPRRGKAVTIDTLKKPYWDSHYAIAKRVIPKEQNSHLRVVQR
ncbi:MULTISPECIES: C40 family peptidase [Pseudomonas]|uniref:C40 family peptidase n=1 Tax=Pseudomonas TaxID=286 RepID=UPI0015A0676F|nr:MULTISPECIES: C40 family peptidase [Pseudomonas]NVZ28687.1 C40 family peptidase [Pseudomonas gingeri]NVZ65501.1 C40 family peptidase [Pseudomonas gingeri]NVZ79315.1 C40 family peptidase [Pseudomonas gingeri]NWA07508.1 C40 family peptidase [Pseudomonas gingeri]BBP79952.1 glycoside hydrolase [Pseudomonas sp. Ost2]